MDGDPRKYYAAQSEAASKKDRRDNPIFVHSALDEYGLTPNEFRVYGRVARRAGEIGACWESIPNMARGLELSGNTVRRCCQVLALARLITELDREGDTTERRIRPISQWKNKAELPGIRKIVLRGEKTHTPPTGGRGITRDRATTGDGPRLPQRRGEPLPPQQGLPLPQQIDEGTPIEGNPMKEIPHTQAMVVSNQQGAVCVSDSLDFLDLDQEQEEPNRWFTEKPHTYEEVFRYTMSLIRGGRRIHTPEGFAEKILEKKLPHHYNAIEAFLMNEGIERQARARRLKEEEAEQLRRQQLEEERRQQLEEEEEAISLLTEISPILLLEARLAIWRKIEEWERGAPQRKRELSEKQERERKAKVEACKKHFKQFSHNPKFSDFFFKITLGTDEQAKAEFEEWLAGQGKAQAATAA